MRYVFKIGRVIGIGLLAVGLLASCDGESLGKITDAMDKMDASVWEQAGIVKPDTTQLETAINAVATEKTEVAMTPWVGVGDTGSAVVDLNLTPGYEDLGGFTGTVNIKDQELAELIGGGVLAPQNEEQKAAMQTGLAEAMATESGSKLLAEALKQELGEEDSAAVRGTMALASGILESVSEQAKAIDNMPEAVTETIDTIAAAFAGGAKSEKAVTESDRVQMQIVTNITASAAALVEDMMAEGPIEGSEESVDAILEKPEVKELINSVLQLAEVSELVPSVVNVDLDSLVNIITGAGGNN